MTVLKAPPEIEELEHHRANEEGAVGLLADAPRPADAFITVGNSARTQVGSDRMRHIDHDDRAVTSPSPRPSLTAATATNRDL